MKISGKLILTVIATIAIGLLTAQGVREIILDQLYEHHCFDDEGFEVVVVLATN